MPCFCLGEHLTNAKFIVQDTMSISLFVIYKQSRWLWAEWRFSNFMPVMTKAHWFIKKSGLRIIVILADDVLWHGTWGTTREASLQCIVVRKVIRKEVAAGVRFDFFWSPSTSCELMWYTWIKLSQRRWKTAHLFANASCVFYKILALVNTRRNHHHVT